MLGHLVPRRRDDPGGFASSQRSWSRLVLGRLLVGRRLVLVHGDARVRADRLIAGDAHTSLAFFIRVRARRSSTGASSRGARPLHWSLRLRSHRRATVFCCDNIAYFRLLGAAVWKIVRGQRARRVLRIASRLVWLSGCCGMRAVDERATLVAVQVGRSSGPLPARGPCRRRSLRCPRRPG